MTRQMPIMRMDPSFPIRDDQYLNDLGLYNADGTFISPVPMKEYASHEAYMEDFNKYHPEEPAVIINPETPDSVTAPIDPDEWTPPISVADLCKRKFPEKKWVVENIFQRATIGQLSAAPNQWKTWVMMHMAICIATGESLFGHFKTEQQGVMIVNEEDPDMLVQERFKILLDDPAANIPIHLHIEKGIKLDDETTALLLAEAKELAIGVIIFDSLSVIHEADENSAQQMGLVFDHMKAFVRAGITVLFTNHHRKKSQDKWRTDDLQEQTRGSSVINAVPAGHITCQEKIENGNKSVIIRQAKLKGAKKLDPFKIRIEEANSKIKLLYEGMHEESLDAATKARNKIYEAIQNTLVWLGKRELREITGVNESLVNTQVKALADAKQIQFKTRAALAKHGVPTPEREKASGQEFCYFRLDADEDKQGSLLDKANEG